MSHLEHIGIALDDADAVATFERLLRAVTYKTEEVQSESVQTHFIDAGGPRIELLTTNNPDSAIGRFLTRRGEGIHHLAFDVDDIDQTFDQVQQAGFQLASQKVSDGADGKRVFFLHPKGTHGVLVEFCQSARTVLHEEEVHVAGRQFLIQRGGLTSGPTTVLLADGANKLATDMLVRALEPFASLAVVVRSGDQPWPSPAHLFEAVGDDAAAVILGTDGSVDFLTELGRGAGFDGSLVAFAGGASVGRIYPLLQFARRALLATTDADHHIFVEAGGASDRDTDSSVKTVVVPTAGGPYSTTAIPLLIPTIRWFLSGSSGA